MTYRLVNESNSIQTIQMNTPTWYSVLELAEDHGWNPMGSVYPDGLELAGFNRSYPELPCAEYWGQEARLVLLEDALNLADALERAYGNYEPVRLPSLHPLFGNGDMEIIYRRQPGLGVLEMMIPFCQQGAFIIEKV